MCLRGVNVTHPCLLPVILGTRQSTLWGALFALDKLESPSNLMEAEIRLFECSPEYEKLSSWNVVSGRQRKFNLLTY